MKNRLAFTLATSIFALVAAAPAFADAWYPYPAQAIEPERPKYSGRRANGLVMTGIGLALTIALSGEEGFADGGVWGLIPMFIGIGLLIAGSLDKREWDAQQRKNDRASM